MKQLLVVMLMLPVLLQAAEERAKFVETPYQEPKVVYDFYLDSPEKMASALYWIRSLINPLSESPYHFSPEFMSIKVVIHGTEIVTVARKNYDKYREVVERMRYYAALGVEFKVCNLAAVDYDYRVEDFYEFIDVVPSAFTELVHWQMKGYGLITPQIIFKSSSNEELR